MLQSYAASGTTVELVNEIAARGSVIEQQQDTIKTLQENLKRTIAERDTAQAEAARLKGEEAKAVEAMNAKAEAAPSPADAPVPALATEREGAGA